MACLKLTYQSENPFLKVEKGNFTATESDMMISISANARIAAPYHFYIDNFQLREGFVKTLNCDRSNLQLVDQESRYRYSFNGMEAENEIYRNGGYDFDARIYDGRSGRFFSVDPLIAKYPMSSSYSFAGNSPIALVDMNGEEPTAAAYKKAAEKLGVPIAAIRSVYVTETGGNTFLANGKVKILYERHYFHNFTGGKFDKSDSDISNISRGGYGKFNEQHNKLARAVALDADAAYKSVSYGGFQIMGSNYKAAGFESPKEMYEALTSPDEDKHLEAFVNFVNSNSSMKKDLQKMDWASFASKYNGPAYKENNYDTKMSDNYNIFKDNPTEGLDDNKDQPSHESSSLDQSGINRIRRNTSKE